MSYLPELRSSLLQAAERRRRIGGPGRSADSVLPDGRRRFQPPRFALAMPTVMAIAVALAVAGIALVFGHGRAPTPPAGGPKPTIPNPGPPPTLRSIPPRDMKLIELAQRKTTAHDHACSPSSHSLPVKSQGSPSGRLLSLLGVLRRPASAADAYARAVFAMSPGEIREVFIRYARPVRVLHRARFFIVPAGDVTGFRVVPARCVAEERSALQRILRHTSVASHAHTVGLQAQYLAWQRYRAAHPEGVCLAAFSAAVGGGGGGSVDCRYTVGDIERGSAQFSLGQLLYGVVPDAVATVTVRFSTVNGRRSRPTTATVVRNVWVIARPRRTSYPSAWIWRDAAGRIVKTVRWPPG